MLLSPAVAALVVLALAGPAGAGHPWHAALLTIDAESLQRLTAAGRPVVAVDVRPPAAYRGGRLPGARSIPLSSLGARRNEVPGEPLVVLYGDEGLEEAATAYRYLRAGGHGNVFVLEGGLAAWRARGYEIER
ncbi:MAG TPA: rhodanese-like domain-containing protein [Methylomirabilota bacterium]